MSSTIAGLSPIRLSICVATFNRAEPLRETLQRISEELRGAEYCDQCEIVVADNASTDASEQVIRSFDDRFVVYVKQNKNIGWERNFNSAVEAARGTYCWLMPDDDLLKPGALAAVWSALGKEPSLVIVNAEHVDAIDNASLLLPRRLEFSNDRVYEGHDLDRCFNETGSHLQYVGAVVIRRSIWRERMSEAYYGSWFPQVGVIFQAPLPGIVVVIAKVLISISVGKHFWMQRSMEIFGYHWPRLVQSLCLSDAIKREVSLRSTNAGSLAFMRACGMYSIADYRKWLRSQLFGPFAKLLALVIAAIPGSLLNAIYYVRYSAGRDNARRQYLQLLRNSQFYVGARDRT